MWIEPKTNWVSTDIFYFIKVDGHDCDYDRIVGNIKELHRMYGEAKLQEMDVPTIEAFPHAGTFNLVRDNVDALYQSLPAAMQQSIQFDEMRSYQANQPIWSYVDLNIIEGNLLRMYKMVKPYYDALLRIPYTLGGGLFNG